MREGVGIASSLQWVSQRFAQRALTGFFAEHWREFLIDAGTAVEHAAKAVIAADNPVRLIVDRQRGQLSEADRAVLSGRSSAPHTSAADWETSLSRVASMSTIRGKDAVRIAHEDLGVELDVAATSDLLHSRNASVHLGDVDIRQLDQHAATLLASANVLWSAVGIRPESMWGYLAPVATVDHVQVHRTVDRDADVRLVLAKQHPYVLGAINSARRSGFLIDGDLTCPACGAAAFRTTDLAARYSGRIPDNVDPYAMLDILDCLVCDLELLGSQIDYVITKISRG